MAEANKDMVNVRGECPRAKAEGAFIAAAAGDALGWPEEIRGKVVGPVSEGPSTVEFREWRRRGGGRFYPHEEVIRAGAYSDDTQLILAVGRARMCVGTSWWNVLTRTELPLWTVYERGGGGATKRAAASWIKGRSPWTSDRRSASSYFAAGGNGVAMRVLPHAVYYAGTDDTSKLIRDVIADGVATHGHPRALLGATAFAYAAWWLFRVERTMRFGELIDTLIRDVKVWSEFPPTLHERNGWFEAANGCAKGEYRQLWNQVSGELEELFRKARHGLDAGAIADDDAILDDLGCFGRSKGAGTISAAAAIYLCARYAPQPAQGILKAAFARGADTDTLASMTGGLMGALGGCDWIPSEWLLVQDANYLRHMANLVARGESAAKERPANLRVVGQKELDALMDSLTNGDSVELEIDGVRTARVTNDQPLRPISKTTIARAWEVQINDGQTIFVTKVGRRAKNKQGQYADSKDRRGSEANASAIEFRTRRFNAMIEFYEHVIGLRPTIRTNSRVHFGILVVVDVGHHDKNTQSVKGDMREGHSRLLIGASDVNATRLRADAEGCVVQQSANTEGDECAFLCCDPDGNLIEVSSHRG